jgi:hypothetical protein
MKNAEFISVEILVILCFNNTLSKLIIELIGYLKKNKMRLQVKELINQIKAVTFEQKSAGISKIFSNGSMNYANCVGLCIWNRVGNVGIVAHIEAGKDYPTIFKNVCSLLLKKMNSSGGNKGSFSIVIFGGGSTAEYSDSFSQSLFDTFGLDFRLNPQDIMDMRNLKARGLIGKAIPINDIFYGAGVLDPSSETFYLDAIGSKIIKVQNDKVQIFQIQK